MPDFRIFGMKRSAQILIFKDVRLPYPQLNCALVIAQRAVLSQSAHSFQWDFLELQYQSNLFAYTALHTCGLKALSQSAQRCVHVSMFVGTYMFMHYVYTGGRLYPNADGLVFVILIGIYV